MILSPSLNFFSVIVFRWGFISFIIDVFLTTDKFFVDVLMFALFFVST